ncbi:hypothetical protein BH18ACI5_BH18ACI5_18800 [soil metagenome]
MNDFLYGIAVCGSGGAGLFFLKYWRQTGDRFFLLFAVAFVALALDWMLLVIVPQAAEYRHLLYVWRLVGFGFILAAIWDKNRTRPDS